MLCCDWLVLFCFLFCFAFFSIFSNRLQTRVRRGEKNHSNQKMEKRVFEEKNKKCVRKRRPSAFLYERSFIFFERALSETHVFCFFFFLKNCWSSVVASVVLPQLCNLHCSFFFRFSRAHISFFIFQTRVRKRPQKHERTFITYVWLFLKKIKKISFIHFQIKEEKVQKKSFQKKKKKTFVAPLILPSCS